MRLVTTVAMVLFLITGQPVSADTSAVPTLAGILLSMQHFPSDEQKATLEGIAADEQVDKDIRMIAGAVSNIAHKVPDEERLVLQAIVGDPSSSDAAKTLASAVLNFNHQLATGDREALTALSG